MCVFGLLLGCLLVLLLFVLVMVLEFLCSCYRCDLFISGCSFVYFAMLFLNLSGLFEIFYALIILSIDVLVDSVMLFFCLFFCVQVYCHVHYICSCCLLTLIGTLL